MHTFLRISPTEQKRDVLQSSMHRFVPWLKPSSGTLKMTVRTIVSGGRARRIFYF